MDPDRAQVRILMRRSLRPATTGQALLGKVRAARDLLAEYDMASFSDRYVASLSAELAAAVTDGEELGTDAASRAADMAVRLLRQLRGEDATEDWPADPDAPATAQDIAWFTQGDEELAALYDLDIVDAGVPRPRTKGEVAQWRRRVEGPPPWPRRVAASG